jgi:hypothetical protein
MVIMSKGQLKAEGSTSELKSKLGNGYRVQVLTPAHDSALEGAAISDEKFDQTETLADPAGALTLIKELERDGISNYQVAGPTIEEVFMKLAADPDAAYDDGPDELQPPVARFVTPDSSTHKDDSTHKDESTLRDNPSSKIDVTTVTVQSKRYDDGKQNQVGALKQGIILFKKRWTVFRRNPLPLVLAVCLPVFAAGLISMLLNNVQNPGCSLQQQVGNSSLQTLSTKDKPLIIAGPSSALSLDKLQLFNGSLPGTKAAVNGQSSANNQTSLLDSIHMVNSIEEFNSYTHEQYGKISPGGIYLGDSKSPPTFNLRSNVGTLGIFSGVVVQNILDVLLTNTQIATQYAFFDFPWPSDTSWALQFSFYFGLVMAAYPAFFALYVCQERVRGVRAMEYSNGVRPFPLWSAYLLFDWAIVIVLSAAIVIVFAGAIGAAWYEIGYFFLVMVLYGLASILLSYTISLLAKSSFAAFALASGGQA